MIGRGVGRGCDWQGGMWGSVIGRCEGGAVIGKGGYGGL